MRTSRHCGGGFAKLVAGYVEKCEATTLLWEHVEIRLDENLDGLFAGIISTRTGASPKSTVPPSVRPSNDGVGHQSSRFHRLAWDIWCIVFTTNT